MTGPALAGCRQRGTDPQWAYRFTNNVNALIEQGDYAKTPVRKFGSRMTQFNLCHDDLCAILNYCDNEADLNRSAGKPILVASLSVAGTVEKFINPCGLDTMYFPASLKSIAIYDTDTLPLSFPTTDTNTVPSLTVVDTSPGLADASFREGFHGGLAILILLRNV